MPKGLGLEQVSRIGSIRVAFYRARRVKTEPWLDNGTLPQVLDEVPEKAVKGSEIKANTK